MLPMGTRLVRNGKPTDEGIAWHEARAAGGVGLIITGGTFVHPGNVPVSRQSIEAYDPDAVPALARLVTRVHEHGTKIFGQLAHSGRELGNTGGEQRDGPLWGPSPLPAADASIPHEMTVQEIASVVEGYAASATNLRRAGYDGVEIHANSGYLLAQFLATRANKRLDQYGGSLPNRMRFLFEIIVAVRQAIGDDPPLGVRLTADEEIEEGMHIADAIEISRALEATGQVDYISVAIGAAASGYVKDMFTPAGCAVDLAGAIKNTTRLPVIASQRITSPALAEQILSTGAADLVGVGRALIADPDWAAKARDGRAAQIRPCVGALEGCHSAPIGCMHNPEAGRELITRTASSEARGAPRPRTIVVVGGGPAGLEVALRAAVRGHAVTLYESEPALGGQVTLAARAPGRAELRALVTYRIDQLIRFAVDVRLGTRATAEQIVGLNPDCVVLATGSRPRLPSFDGARLPHVLNIWDLFGGRPETTTIIERARSAVVADDGSGLWEACSSAEDLARRGLKVQIVTPAVAVGLGVPKDSLRPLLRRLRHYGVIFHPTSRIVRVAPGAVWIRDDLRLEADKKLELTEIAADLVVAFAGKEVDQSVALELGGKIPEVHSIGDCVAPRRIQNAVRDGYRVGCMI